MARVEIYTTAYCSFCVRAKRLLGELGIAYDEIDAGADAAVRDAMIVRTGGKRTVPQIFVDDAYVGGYEELRVLADAGGLGHLQA